ncbi:TetR/AcrR family transcriptional regulator [Plantactinospora sp. KLBMP9567]|uniref:TetR/AcrR family transcriptional regulator n=1 Tax=Plantactinospora sp. KLBMP9567 TaxID=3085900 RepID=UPI0029811A14|nr:TetR/AcrR family transcriptional regulator [Plantactinospora sp. KLBMP9567]MDW5326403.1 TetR/AcrR family transcriptional regulator [Plantactinospora sp. KLBMP9567]
MPRVSDEHLAARRQQILDAARRCFLRNGFHATSMQDVIAEAGLSVGAVYRYFGSKQDLVTSIAESVLDGADQLFATLAATEPPLPLVEALDRALQFVESQTRQDGVFPLAIQVWSESLRDPALAESVARLYAGFRSNFVVLARRAQQAGELPADADVEAVGAALFGLIPGFALQRILAAGPDPKTYLDGVRALLASKGGGE